MQSVADFEAASGLRLPESYGSFLRTHEADDVSGLFVKYAGELRDVRCLLGLRTDDPSYNLANIFRLVSGNIPSETVPIGFDWAGNLYLLACGGASAGAVLWWDHERLPGEDHVEHVAESFTEFMRSLTRDEA